MSEDNWNVVQFCFKAAQGQETPRAVLSARFDRGGFTFEQCRRAVDAGIRERSDSPTSAVVNSGIWRSHPDELDFVLADYAWAIFQHGETPLDGLEIVLERLKDLLVVELEPSGD